MDIVAQTPAVTKSKIIAEGIRLADLARTARIAPSTLSDYLSGRLTNIHRRFDIFSAYCRLSRQRVTTLGFAEFWGLVGGRGAA